MKYLAIASIAVFLLIPAPALAWDFENAYDPAIGGDMPEDSGHNRVYQTRQKKPRYRDRQPQYQGTRNQASDLQSRRYQDNGGVLLDTYTDREYLPGEALPDGGFYDPQKNYDYR